MSLPDVASALTQAVEAVQNAWPVAYPNKAYDGNPPYIRMNISVASGTAATTGDQGSDEYTGFMQIDVCDLVNTGIGNSNEMLEQFRQAFRIGKAFTYNGQTVQITSVKGGPCLTDDAKVTSVLTFYWRSFISRG